MIDQFAGKLVSVGASPFQRATRVMATTVGATVVLKSGQEFRTLGHKK